MKRAIVIAVWLVVLSGVVFVFGFADKTRTSAFCTEVKISVDRRSAHEFITVQDVRERLTNMGYTFQGQKMSDIKVKEIEDALLMLSEVESAEVYKTIDGKIIVTADQRNPIVRIINDDGTSCYIDDKGKLMPLSNKFTARVMVVSGKINEPVAGIDIATISANDSLKHQYLLDDIFQFAKKVNENNFWKAQIMQVYVNESQELELIPRVGPHRIMFGSADKIEEKLNKLSVFYEKGLPVKAWNQYDTINLKYKNQIICSKR